MASDAEGTSKEDKTASPPLCAVCGDQANGMHYRALTCEGCKTFFRRNGKKRAELKCEMGSNGKCVMDLYMRRHCSGCRMKKCLDVGMRLDRLWDKERIKTRKPIVKKLKPKGDPSNAAVSGEPTCSSSVPATQEETQRESTMAVCSTFDSEILESHLQLAAKMKAAYLQSQEIVKKEQTHNVPDRILKSVAAGKLQENTPPSTKGKSKDQPGEVGKKLDAKRETDVAIIDIQQRPRERVIASNAKGRLVGKQGKHLVIEDVVSTEFIPSPDRASTSEVRPPLDAEGTSGSTLTSSECGTRVGVRISSSLTTESTELNYQQVSPSREMLPKSGTLASPTKNSLQKDFDTSGKPESSGRRKRTVSDSCTLSSAVGDGQSTESLEEKQAAPFPQVTHEVELKKCHPKFYRSKSDLRRSPDSTESPSVSFEYVQTLPSVVQNKDSPGSRLSNLALVSPVKNADLGTQSTCTSYVVNDPSQNTSTEKVADTEAPVSAAAAATAGLSFDLSEISKSMGVDPEVFKHFMEVMILVLKNMTMFAKCLQGFSTLSWEDQASLVKGAYLEFLVLTSAELLDMKSKSFISELIPGQAYTQEVGSMGGFGEMFSSVVSFSEKMNKLELRQEETALLFAISIMTPDRPDVQETNSISSEQQILVEALQTCLKHNHPDQTNLFPKTIMLLTDVRDLTEKYMEDIMNLKLKGNEVLPLLCEMFNL